MKLSHVGFVVPLFLFILQHLSFASNTISIQSLAVNSRDTAKVVVSMSNDVAINGLNFMVQYDPARIQPIAIKPVNRSVLVSDAIGNVAGSNSMSFILYDRGGASLAPDSGNIFEITFVADTLPSQVAITHLTFTSGLAVDSSRNPIAFNYINNNIIITGVSDKNLSNGLPREYHLYQNYPNPFNPATTIRFDLPAQSLVSVRIYNILGQLIKTLADDVEEPGYKLLQWNASSVASGVYFYRIEAVAVSNQHKTFTQIKKMMLLK